MNIKNNYNSNNSRGNTRNNSRSNFRSPRSGRGSNPAQIRKNAENNKAKYLAMAKDALSQDDKVMSEYWFQHVHHYDYILQELGNQKNERPERKERITRTEKPKESRKIRVIDTFGGTDENEEKNVASEKESDMMTPQGIPGAGQMAG